jgi:succinylglutamate desuccinylase
MLALGKLLELTLAGREPTEKIQLTLAGTRLHWLAEGALEITPAAHLDSGLDLLLSAGLHGNETAPIELLDRLLQAIASGELLPRARMLLLLGNPEAMRRGVRYTEQDINRLFSGRHEQGSGTEAMRANELENLAGTFFSKPGRERLHYDLHTAIRGSKIEQFALYPYADGRRHCARELGRLASAGIRAVLLQSKPGITFSSFTYAQLQAEAFTLELGKARPFGQNGDVDLQALEDFLQALIEGRDGEPDAAVLEQLQQFSVSREVIRHSDAFRLHLPDDVENFSELVHGSLLAEDLGGVRWIVEEHAARIIFPNPRVRNGLRAGIIVVPASSQQLSADDV